MKILIIGSGGREHSIGLRLKQQGSDELYFAPGNAGTASIGTNVPISDSDTSSLLQFAQKESIDLTVVGPEAPLVLGIVDQFEDAGLKIVGPNKIAAQLEGSKQWAKDLMIRYDIPTASYEVFTEYSSALDYVQNVDSFPIVIKADGLAAGKGVTIAADVAMAEQALKDCLCDHKFKDAGQKVVIESFLEGEEASIFAFTDGETFLPMLPAQDHKAALDGDKGPNTGGMGAYCPAPLVTSDIYEKVNERVFSRLLQAFKSEGVEYKGIIYAGLMIDSDGDPYVVEFNARFGDPETQVVLPLLQTSLCDIFMDIAEGSLSSRRLEWSDESTVCVVLASGGYPGAYEKDKTLGGLDSCDDNESVHIVHAGTKQSGDHIVTSGGRVLGVLASSSSLKEAIDHAYDAIDHITFENKYFRRDIGFKALR
ncbi:phosphoribosylamine--glycine ligase [Candidatus Marinamargulisbacteria bacterium SCGC AG-343-D04]|nr:phosphoribosylamine--glycine ligase [Candidatus Marinamargulisbacteria bacterium SCGC AG-343-D04]